MMRIICRDVIEKISLMNDIKIRMICDSLITRTNIHTHLQRRLALIPHPSALGLWSLVLGSARWPLLWPGPTARCPLYLHAKCMKVAETAALRS